MNPFFCAEASRQAKEDPIGWAAPCSLCILIECPPPWTTDEFASRRVPSDLKTVVEQIYETTSGVQVLLVYSPRLTQEAHPRLILLRQKPGLSNGYSKQEIQVASIAEMAATLQACLADPTLGLEFPESSTRDILICTHSSHDKCCGKYGMPFYRQALAIAAELPFPNLRIWQSSHFGGHRFAPTALDFPDGRCYGRLDASTFTSILTRSGDIQALKKVYRGWSILDGSDYPIAAQVMERELMLKYGWEWFIYSISYQVHQLEAGERVKLTVAKSDGQISQYQADILEDPAKALYLIGDCDGTEAGRFPHMFIRNLVECEKIELHEA